MIPHPYYHLARMIHEERIAAATRPRPEWMYLDAGRTPQQASRAQQLRRWLAHGLVSIALRLEPEWFRLADNALSPDGTAQ